MRVVHNQRQGMMSDDLMTWTSETDTVITCSIIFKRCSESDSLVDSWDEKAMGLPLLQFQPFSRH